MLLPLRSKLEKVAGRLSEAKKSSQNSLEALEQFTFRAGTDDVVPGRETGSNLNSSGPPAGKCTVYNLKAWPSSPTIGSLGIWTVLLAMFELLLARRTLRSPRVSLSHLMASNRPHDLQWPFTLPMYKNNPTKYPPNVQLEQFYSVRAIVDG